MAVPNFRKFLTFLHFLRRQLCHQCSNGTGVSSKLGLTLPAIFPDLLLIDLIEAVGMDYHSNQSLVP
jgi:hypothetical protein